MVEDFFLLGKSQGKKVKKPQSVWTAMLCIVHSEHPCGFLCLFSR